MSKGNKREAFFRSIEREDVKTISWSLRYGGFGVTRPYNDDNVPPIHLAVQCRASKSLRTLVEFVDRMRGQKDIDFRWEDNCNLTPLMLAAQIGWAEGVTQLLRNGADPDIRDSNGKTAANHATSEGHKGIVKLIQQAKEPEAEVTLTPEEARKREEHLERIRRAGEELHKKQMADEAAKEAKLEAKEAVEEALVEASESATWPELRAALAEKRRELSIDHHEEEADEIDPALWSLVTLQKLTLRLPKPALTSIPSGIASLTALTELVLANNSLVALPEEIGFLEQLRALDVECNCLTALPESIKQCTKLESVTVTGNQITSLEPLSHATALLTLRVAKNQLTALDLPFDKFSRLSVISASYNQLAALPPSIGCLQALKELNLADNKITALPQEMGQLNEKRLALLNLENNPIKDRDILKILDRSRTPIKDILVHLQGGKKKKR
eukprot:NODE_1209_length_1640_cov_31.250786_g1074_i0.p1 GENE.NODE_1209_length_1640_cov_31.250786_g1074_i0~~NODE_1209_length_1640_cov_31.250786_g1074_i0.p1  ORF type:complete len:444 (-),score=99.88 NODE_1209_length_1640_cov_31.250786_g1074_i0:241-1572(-)